MTLVLKVDSAELKLWNTSLFWVEESWTQYPFIPRWRLGMPGQLVVQGWQPWWYECGIMVQWSIEFAFATNKEMSRTILTWILCSLKTGRMISRSMAEGGQSKISLNALFEDFIPLPGIQRCLPASRHTNSTSRGVIRIFFYFPSVLMYAPQSQRCSIPGMPRIILFTRTAPEFATDSYICIFQIQKRS